MDMEKRIIQSDELFISQIRDNPCLYDPMVKDFRNMPVKKRVWESIAANMLPQEWKRMAKKDKEKCVSHVQRRWKSLRDGFRRYVRKEANGEYSSKPFQYAEQMKFLLQHQRYKRSDDPYQNENSNYSGCEEEITIIEDKFNGMVSAGVDDDAQRIMSFYLDTPVEPVYQPEEQVYQAEEPMYQPESDDPVYDTMDAAQVSSSESTTDKAQNDGDHMFLMSLLPYFQKMNDSEKLDVQIQFMQILKSKINN